MGVRKMLKQLITPVVHLAVDLWWQLKWNLLRAEWRRILGAYFRCTDRKPFLVVVRESWAYQRAYRCLPDSYFYYNLYRRGISREQALGYQAHYDFFCRLLYRYNRHADGYHYAMKNKILYHQLMAGRDLALPVLRFYWVNGLFYGLDHQALRVEDVETELCTLSVPRLFCKPACGGSGRGILCWSREAGNWVDSEGCRIDVAYLQRLAQTGDALVEEGLEQHKDMTRLHPASVNTIRVVTQFDHQGARVILAGFRAGRDGHFADNVYVGGLFGGVHVDSGQFYPVTYDETARLYETHPSTGVRFSECRVPDFEAVKSLCCRAAEYLPHCRSIGWDVACTPGGPVIVESNQHWGIDFMQRPRGGCAALLRRELLCTPGEVARA